MKKLILLSILLFVISCKTAIPKKKIATFSLSDSWLLTKVSFVEPNMYDKTILFNDATNLCFKDSRWYFNSKDSVGTYAINDLYCTIGKRKISYRFLKTEEKTGYSHIVLNAENKAGKAQDYRIKITELSNDSMQWNYVVYVKNKRYTVNMQFQKA
ncbi:hypothetical protein [Lacinutrix sp. MEBiC02404]